MVEIKGIPAHPVLLAILFPVLAKEQAELEQRLQALLCTPWGIGLCPVTQPQDCDEWL
jgi:hypothetical protein